MVYPSRTMINQQRTLDSKYQLPTTITLHTLSRLSGSTFGLLSLQLVKPAREKRFVTFVGSWDDKWWLDISTVQDAFGYYPI